MEISVVAEREKIELERLALHHTLVGQVRNADFGKIGLPCDGTQRSEFGTVELYPIVVFRMLILESLQHLRSIVLTVFCFFAERL
jgi:hypothetical protein